MYLFIDESGDTGCTGSPTQYFVISVIIFDNVESMQETTIKIDEFKSAEHLDGELHFCKTPNVVRDKFFYFIKNCDFKAKAIYVNKQILYSKFLQTHPDKLYNYMLKLLLDSLNIDIELKIILDGKGNKILEKQLRQYLKSNSKLKIEKIKIKDSKSDVLLQLADMVVSAIGHSYNKQHRDNADKWKNIISKKIDVRAFGNL